MVWSVFVHKTALPSGRGVLALEGVVVKEEQTGQVAVVRRKPDPLCKSMQGLEQFPQRELGKADRVTRRRKSIADESSTVRIEPV